MFCVTASCSFHQFFVQTHTRFGLYKKKLCNLRHYFAPYQCNIIMECILTIPVDDSFKCKVLSKFYIKSNSHHEYEH